MDPVTHDHLDADIKDTVENTLLHLVREFFDEINECKKLSAVRELRLGFESAVFDVADDLAEEIIQQVERQLAEDAMRNRSAITMVGPTFVARFADGQETKMSIYAPHGQLDVGRGVRLAQHAYRSRMKAEPPALVEAYFERDGRVLQSCNADELAATT